MMTIVYKVLRRHEWSAAQAMGVISGSPADAHDEFIHLSAAHQVRGVCDRHFVGENDLLLLTIDADRLGPALKWETSHRGEAYPHLYGLLPLAVVRSVAEIRRGTDGRLVFPVEIP